MTDLEKRSFTQGLAWILAQPDIDRIMLNLQELHDICICSGSDDELEVIAGLCVRRDQVEELCTQIHKGPGLTYENLYKVATYVEDPKKR